MAKRLATDDGAAGDDGAKRQRHGGLGPTEDDLTADVVADVLGERLTDHPKAIKHLEEWCEKRGLELNASNLKQAHLPESADIVDNPIGSAVGFAVEIGERLVITPRGAPVGCRGSSTARAAARRRLVVRLVGLLLHVRGVVRRRGARRDRREAGRLGAARARVHHHLPVDGADAPRRPRVRAPLRAPARARERRRR